MAKHLGLKCDKSLSCGLAGPRRPAELPWAEPPSIGLWCTMPAARCQGHGASPMSTSPNHCVERQLQIARASLHCSLFTGPKQHVPLAATW